MKILVLKKVQQYLESLKIILFEKEYFSFEDSAQKYVDDLFDDIIENLPKYPMKLAPKYFDKYGKGMYYVVFRKNKHTHWYVFFKIDRKYGEEIYKIRYIGNNHTVAQHL